MHNGYSPNGTTVCKAYKPALHSVPTHTEPQVTLMKLAISTYSLAKWQSSQNKSLEQCLDWIAGAGVRAVEFVDLGDKAQKIGPVRYAAQLRRRCERLSLAVAGYCAPANLLVSPRAQRAMVEQLKVHVDIACQLGCKSMRHDVAVGWHTAKRVHGPRTFAHAVKIVVPAIREVADYAQDRGVVTSVENHGFYVQASKRVEQLINTVAHPNFALTIDMGNFLCVGENPVAAVRRLSKYAVMAHVKDFHVKAKRQAPSSGWLQTPTPIALRGAIVGHGDIDIPAQLRALKTAGYKGYLSLEFEGLEEPPTAIRLGLDYLRSKLRQIS